MTKLTTARVPKALEADFTKAEELVSRFFRDRHDDPSRGTIEIAGERYVLVRAASLSVEFFDLVLSLYGSGREVEAQRFARNILYDLAHAIGRSDAERFHAKMGLEDPVARLSAGPIHFAHSGWAFVDIDESSQPVPGPGYLMLYDHPYSFEADAWMRAGRTADFPACIMNAGYSSGWCEASFGLPLVASEVLCRAKGDDCCRFIMAPPDEIERRVEDYMADKPALAARIRGYRIPDFFERKRIEDELRAARDDLERRVAERTRDLEQAGAELQREMEQRARVQEQLQRTQRIESLGRLAGGVAHDFNNLLGVIMGYSSMLQRRTPESDPMHGQLGEITETARLASHLTRQLLTFSRARVMSKQRLDLNQVVHDMAQVLRRMVGDDVDLRIRLVKQPLVVEANRGQLEQLLMNLVINAREAMPEGGSLSLETAPVTGDDGQEQAQLAVEDTGVGIDETSLARIFEPFFSTKRSADGGLGLSTVYGIATQAGGTVTVESERGRGARFDVRLPLCDGPATESLATPDVPEPGDTRSETVLLVEDRVSVRALMATLLGDGGYKVLVAHDPDDALRLARQHPGEIHVLVTDLVMPQRGGRELAALVMAIRPDIKVLFMSGFVEDPAELELCVAGEPGARAGFIAKPFTFTELDQQLRRLLD